MNRDGAAPIKLRRPRRAVATGAGAWFGAAGARTPARLPCWGTRAGSGLSPCPRPVAWTGAEAGFVAVGA